MKRLLLIGGGGHCRSCIDVIEAEDRFTIVGIVDRSEHVGSRVMDHEVLGTDEDLPLFVERHVNCLVTVGQIKRSETRVRLYDLLKSLKAELPVIVSPSAYVSRRTDIGDGTIVMHGAVVNANATIGANCIVNSLALVEHDVVAGSHCHVSTGARINGGARIGSGTFIGSGAIVHEGVQIGPNVVVGAGTTVRADVAEGSVVRGAA